jgi:hypothetical protein
MTLIKRHVRSNVCFRAATHGLLLVLVMACPACRRGAGEDQGQARLAALASMYAKFQIVHQGKLPDNIQELRDFMTSRPELPTLLKQASASSLDELFLSSQDAQPFHLLFGDELEANEYGILGFEQTSRDGKRLVGYRAGFASVIEEAEFQQMTAANAN